MAKPLHAEEIIPLVNGLSVKERLRLLRLISQRPDADDRAAYTALPPGKEEFATDDEPLAWDSDGWDGVV